jgi:hypothetical protein
MTTFLSQITRAAYGAARLLNKTRILEAAAAGNPKPAAKYLRNRIYFKLFGRFLR